MAREAEEQKEAAQFKAGNSGGPGRGKTVDTDSYPPSKRDTRAKNARSTAGRVADAAKVSQQNQR